MLKEKLEKILRGYWKNKTRIENLKRKVEYIDKEIRELRGILAEKEELIPSPTQISFTPGGGYGASEFTPVERSMNIYQETLDFIVDKIEKLKRRKINIRLRILKLEQQTDWINYIAGNHLDEFERRIFEQCYDYLRSNIQVGLALKCDEATVRRKREKILAVFNEFLRVKA